jgi:hypothetical protein
MEFIELESEKSTGVMYIKNSICQYSEGTFFKKLF